MIFQKHELSAEELALVERIADLKRDLGHVAGTPKRWMGALRRETFARVIRASNTIEGFEVSADDAIAAVEREEPLEAKTEAWAAVNGYRSAMTYVLQLADAPRFSYSIDLLNSLHFMMQEYDLSKRPGRWRLGAIRVRDEEKREDVYEGPSVDAVPELMNELIYSLNGADRSVPGVIQAAMGHLNLVMIHPYSDGNGRMARCLQSLILARTGTLAPVFSSIEEYLGRNTQEYYHALSTVGGGSWQPERDVRPWIRFCLIAHFRQATTLARRFKETQLLWDLLEEDIKQRRLPERVIFALADAAMGYRVRNATYRPSAEINNQIASRDFKLLVEVGLLVPVGEKRGRSYVAAPALAAMRSRTKLAKATEDPFEPKP